MIYDGERGRGEGQRVLRSRSMRPMRAPAAVVLPAGAVGMGVGGSDTRRRLVRAVRVILVCFTASPPRRAVICFFDASS